MRITLISAAFIAMIWEVGLSYEKPLEQDDAVLILKQRGAEIQFEQGQPKRPAIAVRCALPGRNDDEGLEALCSLKFIRQIELDAKSEPDNDVLDRLLSLQRIEAVALTGSRWTPENLKQIVKWPRLQSLTLSKMALDDVGLKNLESAKQLELLDLSKTAVSDDGLSVLRSLKKLSRLNLEGTKVQGDGLNSIVNLPNLEELWIGNGELGDAALKIVAKMDKLAAFRIGESAVTDTGMSHLADLKKLRMLSAERLPRGDAYNRIKRANPRLTLNIGLAKFPLLGFPKSSSTLIPVKVQPVRGRPAIKEDEEAPTAKYIIEVEPPNATLAVEGVDVTVTDDGKQKTVCVAKPRPGEPLILVARLEGFKEVRRELLPIPGISASILIRLRPAVQPALKPPLIAGRPVPVDEMLSSRARSRRESIWKNLQLDRAPEQSINSGLAWIARQQGKAGNWKLHEGYPDAGEPMIRTDTGATALALLTFLGDGHTTIDGEYAKVVAPGIQWLKSVQKGNGDFHDHEEIGRQTSFYAHSMATMAICEAYAMSGDVSLKDSCEKAVKFLLDAQHPREGGWRYLPQSEGDLSVTGWGLMALHTARIAQLDVPADSFARATRFLDSVTTKNGSRYKYQRSDSRDKISFPMTANGAVARQWLGWPKDDLAQRDALAFLCSEEDWPSWSPGRRNVYAWLFAGQCLHNYGGAKWIEWYQHVSQLIQSKQESGSALVKGSWHPTKPPGANEEFGSKAGRLYITAMCLLILETPIRHSAIYEP